MKLATTLSVLVAAATVNAVPYNTPYKRAAGVTDEDILNYALTLEHLENAFYSGALAKYDEAAFASAGLPSFARGRFAQIAEHEAIHVSFLTTALGKNATAACTYSFPYTDPASFAALSLVLEGVGTSAYLGAAALISNPAYLTAAGSILITEARHAAWVGSAVNKGEPWSTAFGLPLDLNEVYSLAASFITSCPSTNPSLPVKAFPTLSSTPSTATPGSSITLKYTSSGKPEFLAFFHGLSTSFVPISSGGEATIPSGLQGTVYAVVSTNGTAVSDDSTVAGPAVFDFHFDSQASNSQ